MEPGSPLLIPPGDGREGKIIISAVERRDGKKILIWRAGSRDGIGKYNYWFFRNFRSFSVGFGRFSRFRLFSRVFVFFWSLQAFSIVSVIFNGFRSFDFFGGFPRFLACSVDFGCFSNFWLSSVVWLFSEVFHRFLSFVVSSVIFGHWGGGHFPP